MDNLLHKAGAILVEGYRSGAATREKARFDLVTELDLQIEEMLAEGIRCSHPGAVILGEETGQTGSGSERWVVDPIDGTANFVCGVPHFGISIARETEGQITEAWVYNPVAMELYHGDAAAKESTLNGCAISVSTTNSVRHALVGFGFSARFDNIERYHREWPQLFNTSRKGLGLLAPALNICNVARGRLDCFVDFGSSTTGHSAAALILALAGGHVSNYEETQWDHTTQGIVASNAALAPLPH